MHYLLSFSCRENRCGGTAFLQVPPLRTRGYLDALTWLFSLRAGNGQTGSYKLARWVVPTNALAFTDSIPHAW